jgi:hypothetical protein
VAQFATLCYVAKYDMPTLGQHYTREEIAAEHGGGTMEFLPVLAGKVVCACLRTDTEYNPEAPNVILPGRGREIEYSAKLLIQQGGPIPVYLMRAPDAWEFVGFYEVENSTHFKADLTQYEMQTGRLVTSAIFMREVPK